MSFETMGGEAAWCPTARRTDLPTLQATAGVAEALSRKDIIRSDPVYPQVFYCFIVDRGYNWT